MNVRRWHLVTNILSYIAMVGLVATGFALAYRLPHGSGGRSLFGMTRHEWGDIHFYVAWSMIGLMVLHIVLHRRWVTNTFGVLFSRVRPRKAGAGVGGAVMLGALGFLTVAALAAPWLSTVQDGAGGGQGYRGGRGSAGRSGKGCESERDCATTSTEQGHREGRGNSGRLARGCESERGCATTSTGQGYRGGRGSAGGSGRGRESERGSATMGAGQGYRDGRGSAGRSGRGSGNERGPAATGRAGGQGVGGHSIRGHTTLAEAAALGGLSIQELAARLKLPPGAPAGERLGRLSETHGFSIDGVRNLLGVDSESCDSHSKVATGTEKPIAAPDAHAGHGGEGEGECDHSVRGRSTLAEAAALGGLTVPELTTRLKLPPGASPNERLGRLSQTHGFTIDAVRDIVEKRQTGKVK
ncbi:DUF4405 domain-containing protein [bacterium]|nr:DUF4405 domain-containing protein [bacterium]